MKMNLRFFLIPIVVALVTMALSVIAGLIFTPLMLLGSGGGVGSTVLLGVVMVAYLWVAGKIEIEVVFAIAKKEKDKSIVLG